MSCYLVLSFRVWGRYRLGVIAANRASAVAVVTACWCVMLIGWHVGQSECFVRAIGSLGLVGWLTGSLVGVHC